MKDFLGAPVTQRQVLFTHIGLHIGLCFYRYIDCASLYGCFWWGAFDAPHWMNSKLYFPLTLLLGRFGPCHHQRPSQYYHGGLGNMLMTNGSVTPGTWFLRVPSSLAKTKNTEHISIPRRHGAGCDGKRVKQVSRKSTSFSSFPLPIHLISCTAINSPKESCRRQN